MSATAERFHAEKIKLPLQEARFQTAIFGLIPKKGGDVRKMHKLGESLARQIALETFRNDHRAKVHQLVEMSTLGVGGNGSTTDSICDTLSRMSFLRRPNESLSRYVDRSRKRFFGLGWLQGGVSCTDMDNDRHERRADDMWDAVDAERRKCYKAASLPIV